MDSLEIREELEKNSMYDIIEELLNTSLKESKPILKKYLKLKELALEYMKAIAKEYDDNYLTLGGFGLINNLEATLKWSNFPILPAALAYARYHRVSGKEAKIDMNFYNKLLKEGLKAEIFEVKFLKSLDDKQLYDLLTTGKYRAN